MRALSSFHPSSLVLPTLGELAAHLLEHLLGALHVFVRALELPLARRHLVGELLDALLVGQVLALERLELLAQLVADLGQRVDLVVLQRFLALDLAEPVAISEVLRAQPLQLLLIALVAMLRTLELLRGLAQARRQRVALLRRLLQLLLLLLHQRRGVEPTAEPRLQRRIDLHAAAGLRRDRHGARPAAGERLGRLRGIGRLDEAHLQRSAAHHVGVVERLLLHAHLVDEGAVGRCPGPRPSSVRR